MPRPTGRRSAVCGALCKQRSLAVLSLIMEAVSIALDKYDKKQLVVLAAFLLAVVAFAISLFPGIKKNARLRNAKQGQVVQFFLSLIQLAAAFCQLVLMVSNEEDKIDFSMFFPLAIAAIAVCFAFKNNAEQSDSQSRSLPLTNLPSYNSVPGSPDSGSDRIRISMGEENELFASLIRTQNNSVPGSTPTEPDGHNGISTDEENVESPLTSSEPATLPGSTPIEPDGQNRISIDAENAELPLERSEPASLPSRTPIEPDGVFVDQVSPVSSLRRRSNIARNITSVDHQIWHEPKLRLKDEPWHQWPKLLPGIKPKLLPGIKPVIVRLLECKISIQHRRRQEKLLVEKVLQEKLLKEKLLQEKLLQIEEEMRQIRPQEQTRWKLQQLTEPQASTSKPYKKIARLRDIKPVTKPVANVARPFATVRRRGKRRI